jgi:hypothetical protein
MIISASRRTDLPAFFPKETIHKIVSLTGREQLPLFETGKIVDAVVFWTKNAEPILPYLKNLDKLQIPYYFQYTMNNYPKEIEPNIPNLAHRIETFKNLSNMIRKERVIWRYDPFLTSKYPIKLSVEDVINRFEFIGEHLHNYTSKLVFSFLDPYNKLPSGLYPPTKKEETQIIDAITNMNKSWKLQLATCAEITTNPFIEQNRCIDPVLLKKIGVEIKNTDDKDGTQRNNCHCYPSRDIGEYHTCRHNCSYCYAK